MLEQTLYMLSVSSSYHDVFRIKRKISVCVDYKYTCKLYIKNKYVMLQRDRGGYIVLHAAINYFLLPVDSNLFQSYTTNHTKAGVSSSTSLFCTDIINMDHSYIRI